MKILKFLLIFQFVCLGCTFLSAQNSSTELVDYENFDAELFNQTIFELVNKERKKRKRTAFRYKNKLEQLAYVELKKKRGTYFKADFRKKSRLLKYLQKGRRQVGYPASYLECSFDYLPALQYDKKQKYLYRPDEGEQVDFFIYNGKDKEKTEIEPHTYLSLAQKALKQMGSIGAKNFGRTKFYQDFACATMIVQKEEKRMPYIKVLCVLGGYRLSLLK